MWASAKSSNKRLARDPPARVRRATRRGSAYVMIVQPRFNGGRRARRPIAAGALGLGRFNSKSGQSSAPTSLTGVGTDMKPRAKTRIATRVLTLVAAFVLVCIGLTVSSAAVIHEL